MFYSFGVICGELYKLTVALLRKLHAAIYGELSALAVEHLCKFIEPLSIEKQLNQTIGSHLLTQRNFTYKKFRAKFSKSTFILRAVLGPISINPFALLFHREETFMYSCCIC